MFTRGEFRLQLPNSKAAIGSLSEGRPSRKRSPHLLRAASTRASPGMAIRCYQWPFQEPKLEVATCTYHFFCLFFRAKFQGISDIPPIIMACNMVLTYLHQLDPGIPTDPMQRNDSWISLKQFASFLICACDTALN